jgi:hypothetical protein
MHLLAQDVLLIELAILGIEDIEADRDPIIFGLRRLGTDIAALTEMVLPP